LDKKLSAASEGEGYDESYKPTFLISSESSFKFPNKYLFIKDNYIDL
jgi:hypothetical protein